jgi:flagellar hook-associated protein 3 FlgL
MTRVASFAHSQSLLATTLKRQADVAEGQVQVTTGKKSTKYSGYAPKVSALTFARAAKANAESFANTNKQLTTRLDITAQQIDRLLESAKSAKDTVLTAIANGQATAMMTSLDADTKSAIDSLNGEFDGQYLFGGVRGSAKPVIIQWCRCISE